MAKFTTLLLLGLLLSGILLSGCAEVPGGEPFVKADDSGATEIGVTDTVKANNGFALELYQKYKGDAGNVFFSPWSISSALAMTYEGAKGKTAEEMASVLHFSSDSSVRRPSFARLYNQINEPSKYFQLSTANALWTQKGYAFLTDYLDSVKNYYGGNATDLDFASDTEGSRQTINKWVEGKTNNRIKDLIPPGVLDASTRLVLTNAVYFKGTWLKQFDKKNTYESDFKVSPEKTVKVQMMSLTGDEARFRYAETENLQAIELPYDGNRLSMLVLLPKEESLASFEASLTPEILSQIKGSLVQQEVDVYLPKFKFETKYFMAETLKEMGMPTAFIGGEADFSGMNGKNDLYISAVIHQAFVEVNEEGTEAAAATAVVMRETAAMPKNVFRADHPFIFIIQDNSTGSILFIGRMSDPSSK